MVFDPTQKSLSPDSKLKGNKFNQALHVDAYSGQYNYI